MVTHAGPQEGDRIETQTHLLTKLASFPAEALRGGLLKLRPQSLKNDDLVTKSEHKGMWSHPESLGTLIPFQGGPQEWLSQCD